MSKQRGMIREFEVNSAMLQEAADELEIGVPIRSWYVEAGELVLRLAYGGEARWSPGGPAAPSGVPWRFEAKLREADAADIPSGALDRLKKQELGNILRAWGYQTETLNPLKAEYVEALEWLRQTIDD